MKTLTTILLFSLLTACGFHSVKLVGYGKKFDVPVYEDCFFEHFKEYRASTNYQLSIEVEKDGGKITYYKLTIDGTKSDDADDVFTRNTSKGARVFLTNIIKACSA